MPLNRITHKLGTRWRQSCSMVWMAGAALAWCVCGQARAAETRCSYVKPDRKSTRLNSSHSQISYAVFCLKKKIQQLAAEEPGKENPDRGDERRALERVPERRDKGDERGGDDHEIEQNECQQVRSPSSTRELVCDGTERPTLLSNGDRKSTRLNSSH